MNNDDDDLNTESNKQREYEYGNTIKFEEDSEHEFKAIQISKRPLDLIAEHCEVITTISKTFDTILEIH